MDERYDTHMKNDGKGSENYYDGIIDHKKDDTYICNWHSIMRLLNQYDGRLRLAQDEIKNQKEIIRLQEEKIRKLEELLMLRKVEAKLNDKYRYEDL